MRKQLFCVLMTTLLLTGCGTAGGNEAEELALTIRGEHLGMDRCTAQVSVTADYGQRVYEYEMAVSVDGEEALLVLSAPETVAGISARISGEDSALEFDGLSVETGPLDADGLTPVSAVPALLEAARSGYITACGLEEEGALLRVDCGDPEGTPGEGTEISLWFDAATHALVRGEISVDGFRAISCAFSQFTMQGAASAPPAADLDIF